MKPVSICAITEQASAPNGARISYRFSIIVPTYNRRDVLLQTMSALAALERPWPCELIVVVDGSTDGSAEAARAVPVPFLTRIITQENRGAAAARNRGAAQARGTYLLFLDDDMSADPRLLVEHDAVLSSGVDAAVGHIPLHPATRPTALTVGVERWARLRHERLAATGSRLALEDLLTGQLSVRSATFVGIGGFDTKFTEGGTFGAEDTDFLYRLVSSGAQVRYAGGAVAHQHYVVTPRQLLQQWRQAGRADTILSRKHPGIGAHISKQHGSSTLVGRVLRAASHLPDRVIDVLGRPVVTRAEAHRTDLLTGWGVRALRDTQYWKGVEENGGLHGRHPVVRVLAYHAIEDVADPHTRNYAVPPAQFECQLHALTEAGFHFIGIDELLRYLGGWPVPDRSILLTFDDGYASVALEAAPILARYSASAVVFMATQLVGGYNEWDARCGAAALSLLSATQLQDLIAQGWEVGVHSRSHAHLVALAPAALAEELSLARHDLAAVGLRTPRLFAYPYGEHNAAVRAAVRRAGYVAAFALEATHRAFASHSPFSLPRIEVTRTMSPEVLVQRTLHQPIQPLLALERELRGAARHLIMAAQANRQVR